jgi:hypothetical protein
MATPSTIHGHNAGVAYAGVPFKSSFVNMTALKNRAIVSLLDDYQNNYPLRGDLGDRPDDWFEVRGCGLRKVAIDQIDLHAIRCLLNLFCHFHDLEQSNRLIQSAD